MQLKLAPPGTGHESDLSHEIMDGVLPNRQTATCRRVDRRLRLLAENWAGVER